jgi:hypothetical protein
MRLSPRDPRMPAWQLVLGVSEFGLRNYDAARDEEHKAFDGGYRTYFSYAHLAAPLRSWAKWKKQPPIWPTLTVKWLIDRGVSSSSLLEGLRKAGLPGE